MCCGFRAATVVTEFMENNVPWEMGSHLQVRFMLTELYGKMFALLSFVIWFVEVHCATISERGLTSKTDILSLLAYFSNSILVVWFILAHLKNS